MTIKSVIIITHSSCTFFVHTLPHGLKYCFQNKISIKIIKSCLFWQFHNLKTRFQRKCEIASVRISYFVKTGFPSSCMSCIIEVKLWVTLVKIGYYHTWQSSSLAWGGTLGEKYTLDLERLRLCLVTVFVFYFQKLVFDNIKKKQFSCIFEIKNMFG